MLSFWDTAVCLHFWAKFKMAARGLKKVTGQVFWCFLLPKFFWSDFDETLWDCATHEYYNLTKFWQNPMKKFLKNHKAFSYPSIFTFMNCKELKKISNRKQEEQEFSKNMLLFIYFFNKNPIICNPVIF